MANKRPNFNPDPLAAKVPLWLPMGFIVLGIVSGYVLIAGFAIHMPEFAHIRLQPRLLAIGELPLSFELLGHVPTLVAIEAEDQCRRAATLFGAFRHLLDLLSSISPTQLKLSGTLRSVLWTSSIFRWCEFLNQLVNS